MSTSEQSDVFGDKTNILAYIGALALSYATLKFIWTYIKALTTWGFGKFYPIRSYLLKKGSWAGKLIVFIHAWLQRSFISFLFVFKIVLFNVICDLVFVYITANNVNLNFGCIVTKPD